MHQSFFSYNVSRQFPFRWFTPVAIAGFLILLALFSFINFVSSGYDLIVESSSDPNATIASGSWLHHWPSYVADRVQPTCQAADIPVNSQFFTNQTALEYTLTAVWEEKDGNTTILPSLTYNNNVIEKCTIVSVNMDLSYGASGNQFAFVAWDLVVRTFATCQIDSTGGPLFFNVTQTYDYIPNTISFAGLYEYVGTNFLNHDPLHRATMWWAESLMSWYWTRTARGMEHFKDDPSGQIALRKATILFRVDREFGADIANLEFFDVFYRFILDNSTHPATYINSDDVDPAKKNIGKKINYLNSTDYFPNIWLMADSLAKSAYSTVLADLGQIKARPSILADATTLQSFTEWWDPGHRSYSNAVPGPANSSYEVLKEVTGPLTMTPSVISTVYICQVPRLKSTGNLVAAIVIADLVLLQASWQLYKLIAEYFVGKRPNYNVCEGCLAPANGDCIVVRLRSIGRNGMTEYLNPTDTSRDEVIKAHTDDTVGSGLRRENTTNKIFEYLQFKFWKSNCVS